MYARAQSNLQRGFVGFSLALLFVQACSGTGDKVTTGGATSPARASATPSLRKFKANLDGHQVEASLPSTWRLIPDQSDEKAGLVAFENQQTTLGLSETMFLDGARTVLIPSSLDEARERSMADDDCSNGGSCTELARSSEAQGGALWVSVKTQHAVFVRSWRRAPNGRAVRCGAEASALGAVSTPTWITEASEIEKVRLELEALCQSVRSAL